MISLKAKLRIYKLLEYVITSIVTPRCVERILKFLIKKKEKRKRKKKKETSINEYKSTKSSVDLFSASLVSVSKE